MQPKAARNISIEALRLVAVAGIAVFHTFQWTFQAVCTGLPEYAPLAVLPYSGALGFINLLGCWANEVFFMISGYFLIPSAVRALQKGSSVHDLTRKSLARLQKIVFPTLFYCAACLLVSMYIYPLPEISLHEIGWLTLGIEFIWVYAASVLLVPVIVLARRQIGSKRAPFVVALLVLATFGINCYIAATANEAAGIVLWRKLMSAVTYLVAFIAAGEMRFALGHCNKTSAAQKSKIVLIGLIAATIALELLLSASNQYGTLWMLSYKSTSVISFILAAASVAAAALHQLRHEASAADKAITSLAAGTLGFYAVQSFTCNVWRPIFDNAIYTMVTGIQTGTPRSAGAILLGVLMSLCLAFTLLIMDIVRRAVVDAIKAQINS
ncbi:MAG: acyltransferase family protein [Collinsella sp.]